MPLARTCVAASLVALHGVACAFELTLSDPEFALAVPGVPAIEVHEQPTKPAGAARLLTGSDKTFAVQVEVLRQPNAVSPRVCAGLLLRSLVAQPGMPSRDSIYRAPLNVNTFLVIYALGEGQAQKLHAHIISSAGTSHCANAHFVRRAIPGEDSDLWRTTFTSARVRLPTK